MAVSEARPAARASATERPSALWQQLPPRRWLREIGWRHLVAVSAVLFALFPVIWILSASVNTVDNLAASRLIPRSTTFDSYRELFQNPLTPFGRWLFNSLKISLIAAVLILALSALASYSFSRLR
jgi:arabinogalactan oligomer/maltooligosaccharide transport system permease protein